MIGIRESAVTRLRLAMRNVKRQKTRTAITLGAIAFGVIGLVLSGGFVHDVFLQLGEAIIHSQSGHLQVAKSGFFTLGSRKPDEYVIEKPDQVRAQIAQLGEVDDVMARLNFSGLLTNGRSDYAIVGEGIEPDREARLGSFLVITSGRNLADGDRFGILVGQGVAKALKLQPGDRVSIVLSTRDGAMNTLDFEVVGVFQSFSKDYDARAVRIQLAAAQELLDSKGVNVLVVSLKRTRDTTRAAQSIVAALPPALRLEVRRWEELNDFYAKTVELYDRQFGMLQAIILAMVLLSVTNTVNMTVFERTGEFGTMRALGNRGKDVFTLILAENALLGVIGATLGVIVAVYLAWLISAIGIPMPPPPNSDMGYTAKIRVVPAVVAIAFVIGILATVLASILPALRVARGNVVEALRQNV